MCPRSESNGDRWLRSPQFCPLNYEGSLTLILTFLNHSFNVDFLFDCNKMYYMRNIINISLPSQMAKKVAREVKKGKFASTSEYIRHLIRSEELAEELHKMRAEFPRGWKKRRSTYL